MRNGNNQYNFENRKFENIQLYNGNEWINNVLFNFQLDLLNGDLRYVFIISFLTIIVYAAWRCAIVFELLPKSFEKHIQIDKPNEHVYI